MSDKAAEQEKLHFKDFFRFTRNGKMKSGGAAYSVSLAALYLVVYGAAYYFLIDVLAPLTDGWPIWASDLLGAVVPALVGCAILLLPIWLLADRKWALYGYLVTAVFALAFLIAMLIMLKDEPDALSIFLRLFVIMVPAPLIFGCGSAWLMYKKQMNGGPSGENYD